MYRILYKLEDKLCYLYENLNSGYITKYFWSVIFEKTNDLNSNLGQVSHFLFSHLEIENCKTSEQTTKTHCFTRVLSSTTALPCRKSRDLHQGLAPEMLLSLRTTQT